MARWVARVVSGLLLVLFAGRVIVEGVPDPSTLTRAETLDMIACGIMLAGLLVALWREPPGALLIVVGYAWFSLLDGDLNLTKPFALFPIAAFLFIVAWQLDAATRRGQRPATDRRETE